MLMPPTLAPRHADHELEDHDRGLVFDLATLDRRQMLKLLGFGGIGAGLFVIAGCAPGAVSGATAGAAASVTASSVGGNCAVIPAAASSSVISKS